MAEGRVNTLAKDRLAAMGQQEEEDDDDEEEERYGRQLCASERVCACGLWVGCPAT